MIMVKKGFTKKHILVAVFLAALIPIEAAFAHEWMAPMEAHKIQNPVNNDSESTARGKEIFLDNCAACHGENGMGLSAKEAGLKKGAPNLKKRLSTHSDGDFFWKIQNGKGEMPAFKEDLKDKDIWDIINFIKAE